MIGTPVNLKKALAFAALMGLGLLAQAQQHRANTGIVFQEQDFSNALVLAKKQHKLIFVDAFAVWCAPCRQLKEKTFKNKQLATYFNSQFINVSIDVEKGTGEKFAALYEINSYPTLLFLDEYGTVVRKIEGVTNVLTITAIARSIQKSL